MTGQADICGAGVAIGRTVSDRLTASFNGREDTQITRATRVLCARVIVIAIPRVLTAARDHCIRAHIVITAVCRTDIAIVAIGDACTAIGDFCVLAVAGVTHIVRACIAIITI